MEFSNWSISDYAAWWGAIIATLALVWNIIIAFRSGPRIQVRANPNMQVFPRGPITEGKTFISVTAINRGTASTTVTHFGGFYSDSLWSLVRKRRHQFIVIAHPALGKTLPFVLAPGEEWSNMADQHDMQEYLGRGYLYMGVIHNQRKRPVYVRVRLKA